MESKDDSLVIQNNQTHLISIRISFGSSKTFSNLIELVNIASEYRFV